MLVCRPTGNEIWCSCETGYRWPQERCLQNLTCQEHASAPTGHRCGCLKGLPSKGPFCQLQGGTYLFVKHFLVEWLFDINSQMFLCPLCVHVLTWDFKILPCVSSTDVTLRMSVRLNVGFQEDLRNTSSALYRSYKTDLETAVGFGPRNFLTNEFFGLNWICCIYSGYFAWICQNLWMWTSKLFLYPWDDE